MSCTAVLQARMGSSRLPGKVLVNLAGKPMLVRIIERLQRCRGIDRIVVATTAQPEDAPVAAAAAGLGVGVFRGATDDVVGRVHAALRESGGAGLVLHATGDNPLIDPELAGRLIAAARESRADFTFMTGIPVGSGVDVYRSEALDRIQLGSSTPPHREHLNAWLFDNPEGFSIDALPAPERWQAPTLRLTVDYPEDLQLVRELYARLGSGAGEFGLDLVLRELGSDPALARLNSHFSQQYVSAQAAILRRGAR